MVQFFVIALVNLRLATVLIVVILAGAPARGVGQTTSFDYNRQIGVAKRTSGDQFCFSVANDNLAPGARVVLVWVPVGGNAAMGPEIVEATVAVKRPDPCDIPEAAQSDDSSYGLQGVDVPEFVAPMHFGVIGESAAFRIEGASVTAELDGSAPTEQFRVCTSQEGLHLTVWSGPALEGVRQWRRYAYLGFDVEPTCEARDYQ